MSPADGLRRHAAHNAAQTARSAAARALAAGSAAARLRNFESALETAALIAPPGMVLDEIDARLVRSRLLVYGLALSRSQGLPVDEPLTFPGVLTASVSAALALAVEHARAERAA